VKALFSGENCPSWTSCEFAHNNYWYVQFESEEDAQKVSIYLDIIRNSARTKPVLNRVHAQVLENLKVNTDGKYFFVQVNQ